MNDIGLTQSPAGGRGCGSRRAGGVYACTATSADGLPWYKFLYDPPIPFTGDRFRGIQPAPAEMAQGLPDEYAPFIDMVGKDAYPTVPAFVEEGRRYGFSRYVRETFDFSQLAGRQPALLFIHWRAITVWEHGTCVRGLNFWPCPWWQEMCGPYASEDAVIELDEWEVVADEHYGHCLFHTWPLAYRAHEKIDDQGRVGMPWGSFNPLNVLTTEDRERCDMACAQGAYPTTVYEPGVFMFLPITHFEVVEYVPEDCNVIEAGVPIAVVEE